MNAQQEWMNSSFDLESLKDLASEFGVELQILDIPMVTIDGINHVTKSKCCDGYDCWRYSERAKTGNVMDKSNVSKDEAKAFLFENMADYIKKNTSRRILSASQRAQVLAVVLAATKGEK